MIMLIRLPQLQVVKALMKASKNFEQLYLSGRTHIWGDKFEVYRMYDLFVRHLLNEDNLISANNPTIVSQMNLW